MFTTFALVLITLGLLATFGFFALGAFALFALSAFGLFTAFDLFALAALTAFAGLATLAVAGFALDFRFLEGAILFEGFAAPLLETISIAPFLDGALGAGGP